MPFSIVHKSIIIININPSCCVIHCVIQLCNSRGTVKVSNHQGIGSQDSSLISLVLSNLPGIMHLNEACLTNIAYMISKGKISVKPDTKVLYDNCWMHEITKYPYWEIGI